MKPERKPRLQAGGVAKIIKYCGLAWEKGLMPGFSGNASLRHGRDLMLITRAGAPKGLLKPEDCLLINFQGVVLAGKGTPSSEWRMHAAIYSSYPPCKAILHVHPACMQVLDLLEKDEYLEKNFLDLPLFEAAMWKKNLRFAPASAPGSPELAENCAKALESGLPPFPAGIWLRHHGLAALGKNLESALCLAEELEHLANVQLKIITIPHEAYNNP